MTLREQGKMHAEITGYRLLYVNRRLFEPIGDIPPAEFEQMYYQQQQGWAEAA